MNDTTYTPTTISEIVFANDAAREVIEDIASADGELVDISIKANFRTLGTKFGGAVQDIAKAISTQNPSELVAT